MLYPEFLSSVDSDLFGVAIFDVETKKGTFLIIPDTVDKAVRVSVFAGPQTSSHGMFLPTTHEQLLALSSTIAVHASGQVSGTLERCSTLCFKASYILDLINASERDRRLSNPDSSLTATVDVDENDHCWSLDDTYIPWGTWAGRNNPNILHIETPRRRHPSVCGIRLLIDDSPQEVDETQGLGYILGFTKGSTRPPTGENLGFVPSMPHFSNGNGYDGNRLRPLTQWLPCRKVDVEVKDDDQHPSAAPPFVRRWSPFTYSMSYLVHTCFCSGPLCVQTDYRNETVTFLTV